MKFSLVLFVFALQRSEVIATKNFSFLANALHQLMNFSFPNSFESVQLINYDLELNVFGELVEKVVKNNQAPVTFEILTIKSFKKWDHKVNRSGVYFMNDLESIVYFNEHVEFFNRDPKTINILYFCIDYDGQQLRELTTWDRFFHNHHILVSNNDGDLEILSVFYFIPYECFYLKNSETKVINKFSRKTNKWENNKTFPKKFTNFNGCPLFAALPENLQPFTYLRRSFDGNVRIDGIYVRIVEILQDKYNYQIEYSLAVADDLGYFYDGRVHFLMQMKNNEMATYKAYGGIKHFFITDPIVLTEYLIYVSPPEAYTPFEKLFLPFDGTTWYLLIMTISIGFFVIFFVNVMKKQIQDFVYGRGVATPTLNLIVTLLGGGQILLPGRNFARYILMMFILFCLVMRTAYQAMQFEHMKKTMRRPKFTTIDDLVDDGYTLYSGSRFEITTDSMRRAIANNQTVLNSPFEHHSHLVTAMNDTSFRGAYVVASTDIADTIKRRFEIGYSMESDWYFLEQRIYTSYLGLAFTQNHFLFEPFNEAIKKHLTDTGLINYIVDEFYKVDPNELKIDKDPEPLYMKQLNVVFQIWLALLAVSTIAFFGELLMFRIMKMVSKSIKKLILDSIRHKISQLKTYDA